MSRMSCETCTFLRTDAPLDRGSIRRRLVNLYAFVSSGSTSRHQHYSSSLETLVHAKLVNSVIYGRAVIAVTSAEIPKVHDFSSRGRVGYSTY